MRCGKAREQISLDLDGQLPPDRAVGLTRHLDVCEDCLRYREDLLLGKRMLAATAPQLPENFEWRLQLKLNQTLAQAAAASLHPWHDRQADRAAWLRNFGAAAAVGMAAVLAVAMLAGPHSVPGGAVGGADPAGMVVEARDAVGGDRLEIDRQAARPWGQIAGADQKQVSGGQTPLLGSRPYWEDRGLWSFRTVDDLRAQHQLRLEQENQRLRVSMRQMERQLRALQSPLDTTATPVLDQEVGGDAAPTVR